MTDNNLMALAQLRYFRDEKLRRTDIPWGLGDFSHPDKQAWLDYRQALREITSTSQPYLDESDVLQGVTWPTPPNEGASA